MLGVRQSVALLPTFLDQLADNKQLNHRMRAQRNSCKCMKTMETDSSIQPQLQPHPAEQKMGGPVSRQAPDSQPGAEFSHPQRRPDTFRPTTGGFNRGLWVCARDQKQNIVRVSEQLSVTAAGECKVGSCLPTLAARNLEPIR